ncbi:MAG: toll/interleukin-1 receptor domain-containing protein [Bacilli bacterium]|nr:toll/interleukin-1 receptor domain-containing protein [Bacilli bacterium]
MIGKIFVSYHHESIDKAMEIVNNLEEMGLKCWIAPRDVDFDYAADIVDAISKSSIMLVLIDKGVFESVHVLNELEQAYKYYKENTLTIIPIFLEDVRLNPSMDYYLHRIQSLMAFDKGLAPLIVELRDKIVKAQEAIEKGFAPRNDGLPPLSSDVPVSVSATQVIYQAPGEFSQSERLSNRYYDVDDKYEKRRLKAEGEVLRRFEKGVFDDLSKDREHMNGLITCCMYSHAIMDKLDLAKFDKILGFCYNEKAVYEANYEFKNENVNFYHLDMEDDEMGERLMEYMEKMGIEKFDYIDITMGFIDWKNPFGVLRTLKKYMAKDCRIFVRDVDDGVVMYYPDKDRSFRTFKGFYSRDTLAGYRHSGRRIYSYFKKIKAKNIDLVHSGIDVSDMTEEEKEKMFFAYFGFIPNDFKILARQEPDNKEIAEINEWLEEHYDNLEEEFMDDSFFFNAGYFIYAIHM